MNKYLIEVKNLSYTYPDGTNALRDISFPVKKGESIAIVGPNGAGKSTLLLHLNGCLYPGSGKVVINGIEVNPDTVMRIRRIVGLVFQNPDDQLFMPVVSDDVAFGPLNMGLEEEEVYRRVDEALLRVNALHLKERPPHRLSAGEKRAVSIATVLSMEPEILVLDEPTSSLDPKSRRGLIELLKSIDCTMIVATHDLDFVLDVCRRTIMLHHGRVVADGMTVELFQDTKLLESCLLEKPLRMQSCPLHGKV